MKLLILAVIARLVYSFNPETDFLDCYKCAELGSRKFCDLSGFVDNAWTGACCEVDDSANQCKPGDSNRCSDTYDNS